MSIPLPSLLCRHRELAWEQGLTGSLPRLLMRIWNSLAQHPRLYRRLMHPATRLMHRLSGGSGRFRRVPLAGAWTASRDLPSPQGGSFIAQWSAKRSQEERHE